MTADFSDIQQQAAALQTKYGPLHRDFKEYEDIFFMKDQEKHGQGQDPATLKVTISPTGRNALIGMNRLLRTAKPKFTVEAEEDQAIDTSEVEELLGTIIKESSRTMPVGSVEGDGFFSATTYGLVTMQIDSVDLLLKIKGLPPYEKERLLEIRRRTPFLYTIIPQVESYPKFNRYGLRAHLWRYETTVEEVRERWGGDALPNSKPSSKVTINDWYDMADRVVWVDGEEVPLLNKAHGLPFLPIVHKIAGGTSLFDKPEQQTSPFLYAVAKAKLHQRETLIYSTLFTGMAERGAGILVGIKDAPTNDQIVVNYAAGVRYILGDAVPLNDKGVDNELYNAQKLITELTGQSTIHGQSLGEGVGANVPFSSLVTMAQTGRLPLVDAADAMGAVFAEAGKIVCKWIKHDGIPDTLVPSEIPDLLDIKCEMEPDLPQDKLRNSTIAGALKGLVSKEWIRGNLLNITDSDKMDRDIWTEDTQGILYTELQKAMAPQILQLLMGQGGGQTPPPGPGGMPPEAMPPMPPQGQGMPAMPGTAPMPTAPGGESLPMTDPTAAMMGGV